MRHSCSKEGKTSIWMLVTKPDSISDGFQRMVTENDLWRRTCWGPTSQTRLLLAAKSNYITDMIKRTRCDWHCSVCVTVPWNQQTSQELQPMEGHIHLKSSPWPHSILYQQCIHYFRLSILKPIMLLQQEKLSGQKYFGACCMARSDIWTIKIDLQFDCHNTSVIPSTDCNHFCHIWRLHWLL